MAVGPIDPSAVSLAQPHKPFDGVSPLEDFGSIGATTPGSEAKGTGGFASMFADAVGHANAADAVAHNAALDLAAGRTDDIHGTMIEAQKANIEFKLVGNIRNKITDAFYELWRMSV
ncbi:MAG TPA: flagellar hook-basal body complex protein FliE [Polyangiaceae bacterium]|jgi:flagellar hook-basal body complex protein FliE|nr:flagellar hook-basal body complex protein FliE [Polyangiaceae bacterium]